MSNSIKTNYMDSPNLGYSEYFVKNDSDLSALSPLPGDRAIVADNGAIYICVEKGVWNKFGNTVPSGEVVISSDINDNSTNDEVAGAKAVWDLVKTETSGVEYIENKVSTIDSSSTDAQYPSAAAVWNLAEENKVTIATTIDENSTNEEVAGAGAVWELVLSSITEDTDHIHSLDQSLYIGDLRPGVYRINEEKNIRIPSSNTGGHTIYLTSGYIFITGYHSQNWKQHPSAYIFMGRYIDNDVTCRGMLFSNIGGGDPIRYNIDVKVEDSLNKTTTIDSSSTDVQYPSAKAVYDFVTATVASMMQINKNNVIPGGEES